MISKMLRVERSPLLHRVTGHDMIEFIKVPHESSVEIKNGGKKKERENKYEYRDDFVVFELHKVYSIKS